MQIVRGKVLGSRQLEAGGCKGITLTGMVNDHDLLDVAQNLDTCESPNYIGWTRPPPAVANDKCLVMAQLEEMVGATSGITASDDADPRAGTHRRVLILEHILNIILIGGLEIERNIRVE